jgi:hypothetical protein
VVNGAVGEIDHAGGAVDPLVRRAKHLVDRPRIALDRGLSLKTPHADIKRVRTGNDHRRNRRRIVGALVIVDRDQAIHKGTRGYHRHIAERAGTAFLLRRQPSAAKALRVADNGIQLRRLDRLQYALDLQDCWQVASRSASEHAPRRPP